MGRQIFVTGGTGYMGSRLIPMLLQRGHYVKALARKGSESKLPKGVACVSGDPLQSDSYTESVRGCDTFVHLIGVPHPSPAKAAMFRLIDLPSVQIAAKAAKNAGIQHFVYVSVAHPAPMMHAYIAVRSECEQIINATRIAASFVRPWYVLGPGHRWPYALLPFYWICERLPATREGARRLGLVTLEQMLNALLWTVEHLPETSPQILDVPRIRELGGK